MLHNLMDCVVWIVGSVVGWVGKPSLFGDGRQIIVQPPPESPLGPPGSRPQAGHLLGHPKIIVHHTPLRLAGIIGRAKQCSVP